MISNSTLHYTILRHIIDTGFAPDVPTIGNILGTGTQEIVDGLNALQEYHGVVLHPNEPKVWVIHPFSLAPTNFLVKSKSGIWWGNCAWCSLGIAALLREDASITTRIAAYDKQVVIHIRDGDIREKDLCIHFPIPMKNAWDNVIYTCSNMLVFENETQVDEWSKRHNVPKGDIQPISKIWAFSREWYGNHLSPQWVKWTMQEAREMFAKHNLSGPTWDLETSGKRF